MKFSAITDVDERHEQDGSVFGCVAGKLVRNGKDIVERRFEAIVAVLVHLGLIVC